MSITIDESQRQMILLALAHLAVERPGWKYALGETAKTMDNLLPNGDPAMYTEFYTRAKCMTPSEGVRWKCASERGWKVDELSK